MSIAVVDIRAPLWSTSSRPRASRARPIRGCELTDATADPSGDRLGNKISCNRPMRKAASVGVSPVRYGVSARYGNGSGGTISSCPPAPDSSTQVPK